METISFQPVANIWVIALMCVVAVLLLMVGPSFANLTRDRKMALVFLRTGVIALALLGLFRPGCVQTIEKNQAGVLLFLLDVSRSMELPHVSDDETRWKAMSKMIKENEAKFKELSELKIDVRFFEFDNDVRPLEFVDGIVQLPEQPEGGETDIGTPIYNSSLETRGERLIGVVVASDGVQTVANPEVELTQAATPLSDMQVPLISVLLGAPSDSGQHADVAIKNFSEQQVVNVRNRLTARATLVARGYANQDVKVELVIIDDAGNETIADKPLFVRPRSAFEEMNVELTYKPTEAGEFRMKVRAVPMPGEKAQRNNELDAFLTVNDKGMSILFIDGGLGNEQSFLRRSLGTTEFIDLEYLPLYSNADARDNSWPRAGMTELFDNDTYDVFIFSDVDSAAFSDEALNALTNAVVDRKKGFLMLGGEHSFGPGGYNRTALNAILPIKMSGTERQEFDKEVRKDVHINQPFSLRQARPHYVTQLGQENEPWGSLPELLGANRFIDVKENALVLLESDNAARNPILVGTNVGGRVLAFAGDTLWRWNMKGKKQIGRTYKQEYDQFWRQVVLWLAYWDAKTDETVSLDLPQRRFQPKGRVKFNVKAQSIDGQPVSDAQFQGTLTQPDGTQQTIPISRGGPDDWLELDREMVAAAGLYKLEVAGTRNGEPIGKSERQFVVMDRDVEKSNPVANPERMTILANQTKEFGGKAIDPENLGIVLDEFIENPPIEKLKIPTRWRMGETLPDAAAYLCLFVGLLTVEWYLRKKWGLV